MQRDFALFNRDKNVVIILHNIVDFVSFCLAECLLVGKFALHVVRPEVSTAHDTLFIYDVAFALTSIVRPIAIVDLLLSSVEHTSAAIALSVEVLSIVDVVSNLIEHAAIRVLSIVGPATLIGRPIQVNNLALTVFNKCPVLSKVDVSRHVKQFAHRVANVFIKITFENNT